MRRGIHYDSPISNSDVNQPLKSPKSQLVKETLLLFRRGHSATFQLSEESISVERNQIVHSIPQERRYDQKKRGQFPEATKVAEDADGGAGLVENPISRNQHHRVQALDRLRNSALGKITLKRGKLEYFSPFAALDEIDPCIAKTADAIEKNDLLKLSLHVWRIAMPFPAANPQFRVRSGKDSYREGQ